MAYEQLGQFDDNLAWQVTGTKSAKVLEGDLSVDAWLHEFYGLYFDDDATYKNLSLLATAVQDNGLRVQPFDELFASALEYGEKLGWNASITELAELQAAHSETVLAPLKELRYKALVREALAIGELIASQGELGLWVRLHADDHNPGQFAETEIVTYKVARLHGLVIEKPKYNEPYSAQLLEGRDGALGLWREASALYVPKPF